MSFFLIFYLFLDRGEEREREISVWSHVPPTGDLAHSPHVPWLGMEPATFWFAGQHSIHWATPARADLMSQVEKPQLSGTLSFWFSEDLWAENS